MELIEITDVFNMDTGAPMPLVISNDNSLFVIFYSNEGATFDLDSITIILEFKLYMKYTFGIPGDEALRGHRYYSLGLESYAFFELKESDFIAELIQIESKHPKFNPLRWEAFRHFIITFHDSVFECVAQDFSATTVKGDIYQHGVNALNSLF